MPTQGTLFVDADMLELLKRLAQDIPNESARTLAWEIASDPALIGVLALFAEARGLLSKDEIQTIARKLRELAEINRQRLDEAARKAIGEVAVSATS